MKCPKHVVLRVALQWWSWAGWEWRRVQWNVAMSVRPKRKLMMSRRGARTMTSAPLRSWALWLVALCSSLWSGCWCACGCVSSWTGPCRRPRPIAALTPSRQTRRRLPPRLLSLSGPFAPSPSALSAGEKEIRMIVLCHELNDWFDTTLMSVINLKLYLVSLA